MLVLQRKIGESIIIGDDVKVTVLNNNRGVVSIGIDAPGDVSVHREEIYERIQAEQAIEIDDSELPAHLRDQAG